ncbi:unnamed protein product, partial [Tetraodon nigroviridis]
QLLLSGDPMLQTASAKCIAAVLVHSGTQGSTPLIKADIPEFLFDRLASSGSEVMLWSAYSCLVLLSEDPLFFSQCHSVYGIDSLVRSLKEALQLTNLEVPKQGLLLLTEMLQRGVLRSQMDEVHLKLLYHVSYLRLLQVLLDTDLVTEVVCLNSSPGLVGPKPLSVEDGALYPLGSRGAQCLATVISGLFLQLLQCGSTTLLWEPDLLLVMEAVEKRGLEELSDEAAQALRLFLTQVHSLQRIPLFFWNNRHFKYRNLIPSLCVRFTESSSFDRMSSVSVYDIFYLIADSEDAVTVKVYL